MIFSRANLSNLSTSLFIQCCGVVTGVFTARLLGPVARGELVEARAHGLPCISTTAGGVPSTVRHGYDALLVTPRNSRALSHAIERMIEDNRLRQALIRNGFTAARRQTLDHFVVTVRRELEWQTKTASAAVPQA